MVLYRRRSRPIRQRLAIVVVVVREARATRQNGEDYQLATKWTLGRRTMRMPERRQKRVVSSRLGLIQPRRPMSTRIAGRMVTAATNATKIAIANAGPTVENTAAG